MWQYNQTPDTRDYYSGMQSRQSGDALHYGVLGMKWGRRKQIHQARKDAKEFARAKMFYGEGAGTRRKLIKNTVNQRSKEATYKKEFDRALAKQDMASHAAKARGERKRKDAKKFAGQTARGVYHTVRRDGARVSALVGTTAAVGTAAAAVAKATGTDKVIINKINSAIAKRMYKHKY